MIPVFERAKTVHALYRATTVIGIIETVKIFNYLGCQESSNLNYDMENKLQIFNYLCGKAKHTLRYRTERETISNSRKFQQWHLAYV
jgi:hypothetical protein